MNLIARSMHFSRYNPIVATLLLGSFIGWIIGSLYWPIPRPFTFGGIATNEWWRLVSPIFIHFGLMHFIFNALWLSMLGARIEQHSGAQHLLLIVAVSAIASNVGQFMWSGSIAFGGMSGVIYALLGYLWIRNGLAPSPMLHLPKELIGFMVAWLVICMTGILDFLLGIGVANAAHLVGLISGMVLGLVFGLVARLQRGQ